MNYSNLLELRELRNQEKAIKARIESISTEAANEAVAILAARGEDKGKFLVEGHHFELRRAETFDFVGKPQKYTMAEGVAFRQKTAEQTVLKAQSAAITKVLKTLRDNFPALHPNIAPDSVEYTVVCVD
jgi:uncharacterized cupredoxin-like copper-binding protein